MIIIKNIKTITIIDNDDYNKTQYIHINNMDGKGLELEVKKGKVNFVIEKDIYSGTKINIEINCNTDEYGILYSQRQKQIIENISDNDLIKELKKRNVLSEEIVYKIKE